MMAVKSGELFSDEEPLAAAGACLGEMVAIRV